MTAARKYRSDDPEWPVPLPLEAITELKVRKVGATLVVTLPKAARQRYGLYAGDLVVIEETRAGLLIRPARPVAVCSKCGNPAMGDGQ